MAEDTSKLERDTTGDTACPDMLEALVLERRKHLGDAPDSDLQHGRWGLALSGGGVRSATFCYGLVSAMAKSKVFSRFDYLSTVSGGGYIGTMIGRLAQQGSGADDLQTKLGTEAGAEVRRWLRSNSRFLIPRGSSDWLYAIVTFIRNLIAIHLELGVLGLLLGCVLASVDILAWWSLDQLINTATGQSREFWLGTWDLVSRFPTLWLGLLIAVPIAAVFTVAYWMSPRCHSGLQGDGPRKKVTERLAATCLCIAAILLLGAIDWIAWRIANRGEALAQFGVGFALVLPALRTLLPMIQEGQAGSHAARLINMSTLIDIAGRAALIVLAVFWTALVHWLCTQHVGGGDGSQVDFQGAAVRLAWTALAISTWVLVTSLHLDFLNRSSLHHFYRSRLANTYLGAVNPGRKDKKLREHDDGDDMPLRDYKPHCHGGPVHMMSVCVNQTFQKHGLFNIDRQGEIMTVVGPGYFRTESHDDWQKFPQGEAISVGTWMAISGAAAAPGMGSGSKPGWSALLLTLGIRLGYWWDSGVEITRSPRLARYSPKYNYLLGELFGRLPGSARRVQYLSDGGHCENTGVYPLLYQQCELIVVADCGADPDYRFDDLENLLRRARIDLDIDIRFIKPTQGLPTCVGTLDNIASKTSNACIAVARIHYPGDKMGTLVLVKPNLMKDLPEDLHNYHRDNRTFPQQSTADQFFAEDQWESYFSLGRHIGSFLDQAFFEDLPTKAAAAAPAICQAIGSVAMPSSNDTVAEAKEVNTSTEAAGAQRVPLRIGTQAVATSTLGIGTLLAATTGVWTAFQGGTPREIASKLDPQVLRPMYANFAELPLTPSAESEPAVAKLATEVMYVWEQAKAVGQEAALQEPSTVTAIFRTAAERCYPLRDRYAACGTLLSADESCPRPITQASPISQRLGYWARFDPAARDTGSRPRSYCEEVVWAHENMEPRTDTAPSETAELTTAMKTATNYGEIGRVPASTRAKVELSTRTTIQAGTAPGATAADTECQGMTIYVQIYGPAGRDNVRVLRTFWRAAGASVPPITDINAIATRQGRSPKQLFDVPTVIYHASGDGTEPERCARQLAQLAQQPPGVWAVQPLPAHLKPSLNTIEVWLPPAAVAAGFDQWLGKRAYCSQEKSRVEAQDVFTVRCHPTQSGCAAQVGVGAVEMVNHCAGISDGDLGRLLPFRGVSGAFYNIGQTQFGPPFPEPVK